MKKAIRLALQDRSFRNRLLKDPTTAIMIEPQLGYPIDPETHQALLSAADNIRFAARQADEAIETLAIGMIFDFCFPTCKGAEALLKQPPRISVDWQPQGSVQRMVDAALRLERSAPELIADMLEAAAKAVEIIPDADDSTCGVLAASQIREQADQIRK